MSPRRTALPVSPPVLFVHGMWLHSSSWQNWIELFASEGFDASAPAWPGERPSVAQTRANSGGIAGVGMERLLTHYAELIRGLPAQPVLIGHSLGGTVVQKLLSAGYGAAGVVLDSAHVDGELPGALPALRAGLPALAEPGTAAGTAISLTDYQFRFAFGRNLDAAASDALFRTYAIPSPASLLLEPGTAAIDLPPIPGRTTQQAAPLLVLESAAARASVGPSAGSPVGGRRILPDSASELIRFADRGASLAMDDGWEDVAGSALAWVRQRFGTRTPGSAAGRGRTALRGTAA